MTLCAHSYSLPLPWNCLKYESGIDLEQRPNCQLIRLYSEHLNFSKAS